MLKLDTITELSVLEEIVPEWDRLDQSLSPRMPFRSPLWCLLWWKHFRRDGLKARDELRVFVLRDDQHRLVGLAPMFVTQRPGRGPVRSRELQFFGADPYVTELRGPLMRPDHAAEVIATLSKHIGTSNVDWTQWRGLLVPDEFDAWDTPFHAEDVLGTIDYYLTVGENWETFKSGLPRNIKESIRKCYNSLSRENLAFQLRVVQSPHDAPAAIETFFRLHRTRSETEGTINHNDVFQNPQARAFLMDYCIALADRGGLRIFQLLIADQVVATRIGFSLADELYLYFSGYDVAWKRFSVMTTTVAEAIKWAIEQRYKIVNLSTGTDVSKTRWRPQQIVFRGGITVSASPFSRVAYRLVEKLRHRRSD